MELNQKTKRISNGVLPLVAGASRLIMRENDIVKRPKQCNCITFYSKKCKRLVTLMSGLEFRRACQLEADPKVMRYEEHPFRIEFNDDGKIKSVCPDFVVFGSNGSRTVEVVTSKVTLMRPEAVCRLAKKMTLLKKYGYRVEILTG